jgi:hypothetical protein
MDGLVSTGNKFPSTILNRFFPSEKKNFIYFINIFFETVEKRNDMQKHSSTCIVYMLSFSTDSLICILEIENHFNAFLCGYFAINFVINSICTIL